MSRMIWVLAVLLSHWRRHPMQLATLLIGLISATALWSGVQALNLQARLSYDRAAATFGGARTAALVGRDGKPFSQQLFVELRRAGWPVSPVLEGRVQIGGRSFRLLGIEPVTLPAEVGNAPAIGRADLQSFVTPPGQTLVAPEVLTELNLPEGATPTSSGGTLLPPLRAQAQLVPGVLVVDIGIAQRLLNMPDQVSRLLIGKAKSRRAPLETVVGDQLRLAEPDAESDLERLTDSFHLNLTAFGLLSFVVGLFIVNSAIGLAFEQRLPMLRTLRACGVSARMLDCRPHHQRARRAGGGDCKSRESNPASGAGRCAALCLATGAAPMVDVPECAGAGRVDCRRLLSVVRRFAGFGICRARGVAAWRRTWPAGDPGTRAFPRSATRASPARDLVLGRQPPAAFGIVAGLDGAIARTRRQCRCRHHGGKLQPDIHQLARRTVGGGHLHQRIQRHTGDRDQGMAA